jgi:urease accessory protein UreF
LFLEQNAKPVFCFGNARFPADLDQYLLRHSELAEWLTASTVPTHTRLTSAEIGKLSPEDQAEYRKFLKEYQSVKREYERWLEALGNAIVPQQAAVAWRRVGEILGLPTQPF